MVKDFGFKVKGSVRGVSWILLNYDGIPDYALGVRVLPRTNSKPQSPGIRGPASSHEITRQNTNPKGEG